MFALGPENLRFAQRHFFVPPVVRLNAGTASRGDNQQELCCRIHGDRVLWDHRSKSTPGPTVLTERLTAPAGAEDAGSSSRATMLQRVDSDGSRREARGEEAEQ